MFNEILKIKTQLDDSTARQMEQNLVSRFSTVAERFGKGLKNVLKGTVLGISLGLLNKILNPIEELDAKIKNLLGKGQSATDLAERVGTSSGKITQAQSVARTLGLTPEQFNEALLKFTDGVEKAAEEFQNPLGPHSDASILLAPFIKYQDRLQGFEEFLKFLNQTGKSAGTSEGLTFRGNQILSDAGRRGQTLTEDQKRSLASSGDILNRTGADSRKKFEEVVFGAQQFGGIRKLINQNGDIEGISNGLKLAPSDKLTAANQKLNDLNTQKNILDVQNQTKDFLAAAAKVNQDFIDALAKSEARDESEATERLDSYKNLKRGADAIQDVAAGIHLVLDKLSEGLGLLKGVTGFIPGIKNAPFYKGLFKGKGKE